MQEQWGHVTQGLVESDWWNTGLTSQRPARHEVTGGSDTTGYNVQCCVCSEIVEDDTAPGLHIVSIVSILCIMHVVRHDSA